MRVSVRERRRIVNRRIAECREFVHHILGGEEEYLRLTKDMDHDQLAHLLGPLLMTYSPRVAGLMFVGEILEIQRLAEEHVREKSV